MSLGMLVAIVTAGIVLVVWAVHRSGGSEQPTIDDAGSAIMEFGRAYPVEPIRDVILTEDRRAAFLRLADGRAGFLQVIGRHYFARLLAQDAVRVEGLEGDRGLKLAFRETTFKGGTYRFASPDLAAEVSLWLVGSLVAPPPKDAERRSQELEGPGHA
jgi:hypothetical protein